MLLTSKEDFRIPHISIVLQGSHTQVQEMFIAGGLISLWKSMPGDETYEKLPWYSDQGVQEVLIIDRDTKVWPFTASREGN